MNWIKIIAKLLPFGILMFISWGYIYIYDAYGFERTLLAMLYLGFLVMGGIVNTINSTLQKKNFKTVFSQEELVTVVYALRVAREKEREIEHRKEYLNEEKKLLNMLVSLYDYVPLKGAKEIEAEEKVFQREMKDVPKRWRHKPD